MTHDELLAKIGSFTCCAGAHELALRAVVELHKPVEITLPSGNLGTDCLMCKGYAHPCETIRAIEKELQ